MSDQPDPKDYDNVGDYREAWQAANPGGGQVDMTYDEETGKADAAFGAFFPDDEDDD